MPYAPGDVKGDPHCSVDVPGFPVYMDNQSEEKDNPVWVF